MKYQRGSNTQRHWLEPKWTAYRRQLYTEWIPDEDLRKYDYITTDIRIEFESFRLP